MNHHPDTPSSFSAVPGHTRLYRRENGVYYLRAKVPEVLRPIVKKTEIRKSLATSDYRAALARVKVESIRVDVLFRNARAELESRKPGTAKLSREEAIWLVSDWFVKAEEQAEAWTERELPKIEVEEAEMIADNLKTDIAVLAGSERFACYDKDAVAARELESILLSKEGNRWGVAKGSEDFEKLTPLFRKAKIETLTRTVDRIEGRGLSPTDPHFAQLNARTQLPPPPRPTMLLGKFLDDFMDYQRATHTETTPAAYALPVRALRELLGERCHLHTITRQQIEKVCAVLADLPKNMGQRYPRLTLEDATAAAARAGMTVKRSARTLGNEYALLVAIFNYAVDEGLLTENPAKGRKLRESFKVKKRNKRELFTAEELQEIFSAPLYTGCIDDGAGYATAGPNKPRGGRFWVPLLALFHGLRCNEACQLYIEDVKELEGIPYLHVRADLDEEEDGESGKRLKNQSSERKLPIHPELIRIGFLDYVATRRTDDTSPLLFPTLTRHKTTGRFSHPFSKWFSAFLVRALGHKPKAVFHSFRHHFRAACTEAGLQIEIVEALGGWKPEGSSEIEYRHTRLSDLLKAIQKIKYPGLSLSHLYLESMHPVAFQPARRERRRGGAAS